jgi:hypothetical protein
LIIKAIWPYLGTHLLFSRHGTVVGIETVVASGFST